MGLSKYLSNSRLVKGKWEVLPTIWPYKPGFGTYNARRKLVLDTGLSREEAQQRCDELNRSRA